MNSILNKVLDIEYKISTLPKGYISHKNINNKDYYYHQYKKNGKLISKYLKESEISDLRNNILLRKKLEEELKEIKKSKEYKTLSKVEDIHFLAINVITGKKLKEFCETAKDLPKRKTLFSELDNFIHSDFDGKICLIKGLFKTGKHTLIKQSILSMTKTDFNSVAYITPLYGSSLSNIVTDIQTLYALGFRYIYINEITETNDFIDYGKILATNFGKVMKIVVTTQKSLAILFSTYETLWKCNIVIDTTFISFNEYKKITSKNSLDDYIKDGPMLCRDTPFKNLEDVRNYTYYAVARNLVYSIANLKGGKNLFSLADLYFNRHLYDAIQFYIEYQTKLFLSNIIKNAIYVEQDGKLKILLNAVLEINTKNLEEKKEYEITEEQLDLIEENLNLMDFLLDVPLNQKEDKSNKKNFYNFFYFSNVNKIHINHFLYKCITSSLSITVKDKAMIYNYINSLLDSYIMRDVILSHLYFFYKGDKDISIEIIDSKRYPLNIFISDKSRGECKTLLVINSEKEQDISSCSFPNIQVLYLGPTFTNKNGIKFINIEEYLLK